ncbi:MAG: succinate dehydrogenase assembly factor 2 [Silicimonas sp.]|nr:succinate dehydrogenase assembly factor 2 [Silicimonas sp.]
MIDRETRIRRLGIRSWRRGTKEMDLILGPFFDRCGASLADEAIDHYEALLAENDQDLYQWFSGQAAEPEVHSTILATIRNHHAARIAKA